MRDSRSSRWQREGAGERRQAGRGGKEEEITRTKGKTAGDRAAREISRFLCAKMFALGLKKSCAFQGLNGIVHIEAEADAVMSTLWKLHKMFLFSKACHEFFPQETFFL